MNNKIHICENLGFCGGVRNAVWNSVISIEKNKRVVVFGDLIHNDRVLLELKMNGVEIIKNIDHQIPRLEISISMLAVDYAFVRQNDICWQADPI